MNQKSFIDVKADKLDALTVRCDNMLESKDGLHWREVEIAVQNIVDHYAGKVRTEKMLLRAIDRLKEIKENVTFRAENPHELGRCLEVESVIENAEMLLRASLERKESRQKPFGFFRADFPESNDEDWFVFLAQRLKGEQVQFSKIEINKSK